MTKSRMVKLLNLMRKLNKLIKECEGNEENLIRHLQDSYDRLVRAHRTGMGLLNRVNAEKRQKIVDMYREGVKIPTIVRLAKVSHVTIGIIARQEGLYRNKLKANGQKSQSMRSRIPDMTFWY